jgi:hypothetical protein
VILKKGLGEVNMLLQMEMRAKLSERQKWVENICPSLSKG